MDAPSALCSQHLAREAVGICVRCRAAMCSDCITKIDGINHCRACLEELTRAAPERAQARSLLPPPVALGMGLLTLSALMYLMIEVLMPGSAAP